MKHPWTACAFAEREGKVAPVAHVHRHLQHLLYRFLRASRAETPQGSLPACASGDVATRIRPATGRPSLFPTPIPASPLVGLTTFLPSQERDGLTTFHKVDSDGGGALYSPGALRVHDRVQARPCTRYGALLAQACQHLWLACGNDVYQEFTCVHHTAHPAPSPPDAGRYTVPSRFGCQSGDCGYRVRGHWTARYLAAVPRRILLMEQQVWSLLRARQSTLRPRVAVPPPHRPFHGHATPIIARSMMLRPNDSWSTCILQGIATFLHYASRRSAAYRYTTLPF